jgi:hypothetical protein
VNRPGVAAGLLTVAAAGSVVLVALEWSQTVPGATSAQICGAVGDLRDALDLSSLGDQAVLRARAAQVADMLSAPSKKDGPTGAAAVSHKIVAVLDDQGATVGDLAAAIEPIVAQCPELSP